MSRLFSTLPRDVQQRIEEIIAQWKVVDGEYSGDVFWLIDRLYDAE